MPWEGKLQGCTAGKEVERDRPFWQQKTIGSGLLSCPVPSGPALRRHGKLEKGHGENTAHQFSCKIQSTTKEEEQEQEEEEVVPYNLVDSRRLKSL